MIRALLLALLAALLVGGGLALATPTAATHHLPVAGDRFSFSEVVTVGNGTGNYTGYDDGTFSNGSVAVTNILPNGTANATYGNTNSWRDNQGDSESWSSAGWFWFSPTTFHYLRNTDNQTGYTNPYVWFYIDNTLAPGGSFYLLNTPMSLGSTNSTFPLAISPTGYVQTLSGQGSGSYQRNDSYGVFTATYTWKAFFDPSTGYIVGYLYTEQDRDPGGNGFDLQDRLSVSSTSYPLKAASAPSSPGPSGGPDLLLLGLLAVVILVVIIVIIVAMLARRARRAKLPAHSTGGYVPYAPPPGTPTAPGIDLTAKDQPAVQQVVVREKVKVNCRYCGALVDPGAPTCPQCGAPLG